MLLRFNSDDFDDLDLTLGFSDAKDGRQFTVQVDFETFSEVTSSPIPRLQP